MQWHDGGVQIGMTLPQNPRQLDPTGMMVTVQDKAKPVAGAQVSAELAMPDMQMPENKTALAMVSPGVYRGTTRFTMAGRWKVTLTIRMPGGATLHHTLDPVTVE